MKPSTDKAADEKVGAGKKLDVDKKLEARFDRAVKKLREELAEGDIRIIPEAKDNPRLQVMNEVLKKAARRKIN